jgi:hypothetical protein
VIDPSVSVPTAKAHKPASVAEADPGLDLLEEGAVELEGPTLSVSMMNAWPSPRGTKTIISSGRPDLPEWSAGETLRPIALARTGTAAFPSN